MRVTIKDIAARAGVSKTTVSFALNDPERISEQTRKRVLDAVAELGYEPDSVARALATRRLGAIGLLLPQALPESLENPYLCELMRGIGEVCEEHGLALSMLPPIRGMAEEAARKAAVDAILAIGLEPDAEVTKILLRRHLPFVSIDGASTSAVPNIGIDDESAAEALMSHVLELGHRRIGILRLSPEAWTHGGSSGHSPVSQRRLSGFRLALAREGIELGGPDALVVIAGESFEGGREATERLLSESGGEFTAIVAMADIVALGAYDALRSKGYRLPMDMSVAGFDDIPLASRSSPTLTTIHQPGLEKGAVAARIVIELLEGGQAESRNLVASLVARESTTRPRSRR
ncbi:MAG TPA: LacI family DNA-binding transcriptional regulator [Rectinemataceae bacterium]|nr:LacI family DNA-binding transcriptional regulator [Rectinemataceae bacterium]